GVMLHASGWLGENNRAYFEEQRRKLAAAGLLGDFLHVECPDHASKVRFLAGLDVLSVPTVYREPKGLYVLEALANPVPGVPPRHGSFPELVQLTGGGLLFEPDALDGLALALKQLHDDGALRRRLGAAGQETVWRSFTAQRMAEETAFVYAGYLNRETARA